MINFAKLRVLTRFFSELEVPALCHQRIKVFCLNEFSKNSLNLFHTLVRGQVLAYLVWLPKIVNTL